MGHSDVIRKTAGFLVLLLLFVGTAYSDVSEKELIEIDYLISHINNSDIYTLICGIIKALGETKYPVCGKLGT